MIRDSSTCRLRDRAPWLRVRVRAKRKNLENLSRFDLTDIFTLLVLTSVSYPTQRKYHGELEAHLVRSSFLLAIFFHLKAAGPAAEVRSGAVEHSPGTDMDPTRGPGTFILKRSLLQQNS